MTFPATCLLATPVQLVPRQRKAEMARAGVDGDVGTDLTRLDLDRGSRRLVDDVGGEGRSLDEAAACVRDVPGVDSGPLLRVRVECEIRMCRARQALEREPVDVPPTGSTATQLLAVSRTRKPVHVTGPGSA